MNTRDEFSFLQAAAADVAPQLLGCLLIRDVGGVRLIGRIVETEAYDQTDAASHSYRGRTPRTDVMFGPAGHLYVYFTYGMHYCCNIVTGPIGQGSAVLIRAIEPLEGHKERAAMVRQRQNQAGPEDATLTNGPAKLCQALAIDRQLNGHDLRRPPLRLLTSGPGVLRPAPSDIVQTTRIGIREAKDMPWRFYIRDNRYVSRA